MALFRKFFNRKPPEGLLEISDRVYDFDCCFAVNVLGHDDYQDFVGGVMTQLRDYYPDASFAVFNFRDGENHSGIANILSEYDITVTDYPRQYENCPLLTMEMIHHFLKSSESWLAGHMNMLLLHCEYGGWSLLAFMLAALLIYSKQYTGEQRTLDMIYKQASRGHLQLMLPLNPLPSQLRYLQYVSRRKLGSEWPPLDRELTLDCIILRVIPTMGGEGGCHPIFRIHGQDPLIAADRSPKVLYSSSVVHHYKQTDSEMVKIDINCRIQGDVVLECITLHHDLQLEEITFRIMFNTAFIGSNIMILNRDEIDTPWNAQDHFSMDFRAEFLFSEMDSFSSLIPHERLITEVKEGLPSEASGKVQDVFRNVEWLEQEADADQQHAGKENMFQSFLQSARIEKMESCCHEVAKEENQETLIHPSIRNKNLDSGAVDAFEVQVDTKTDVAVNMLQITASIVLQEKLETSLCAGKEKIDARSPQSVSVEILDSTSPECAKEDALETASLKRAGKENLVNVSPNGVLEMAVMGKPGSNIISDKSNPKALGSDMISSQPKLLVEKSVESSTSLDLNLLEKKIDSKELQCASERPVQSKIVSPIIFRGSLSNPASKCLQGSPSSLTRYASASSVVGIPALLHDTSVNNKVGTHVVTVSPRSSLVPQLCKSVSPNLLSVVPPFELPSSSPVASDNSEKVSATTFPSQPPPSLLPKSPPSLPMLSSQSSIHNLNVPNELDSPQKSDSETLAQDSGNSPSVPCSSSSHFQHSGMPQSSSTNNSFTPAPSPPPPPLFSSTAASLSVKNSLTSPLPPPLPSSFCSSLVAEENTKNSSPIAPPLPQIALSSDLVPSLLQEKRTAIDTSSLKLPPPSLCLLSDSSITGITSTPPPPPPTAFSTIKYSTSTPTPLTPPLQVSNSSSGLISLIVPENNLGVAASPSPSPILRSGLLPGVAVTSLEQPPAPPPPPPPSCTLKEAPSPTENLSSTPQLLQPAVLEVASLNGSISSLLPLKSCLTADRPPQPPPPPTHSKALSNPAAMSAPAPPPPPSFPPKESIVKSSPHIPPPPAPFSLQKIGATLQSNSSGRSGNIPPTPSPPLGSKGRLQSSSNTKHQSQNKKTSLKQYHWVKLTRAMQGSLWADAQKPEEASKTPEFDMSELESLFSTTILSSDHGSTKGKLSRASRNKSDKVNLIDLRRAYNCEIMLTKVKIPLPDLMSSLLALDDSALDVDQVDNLIKFCPTKEEMELLKNYNGDKENLGKCEQYFLELMKVPRVESKLRVFAFKIQFSSEVSDLRNALNIVNSASEEVRKSIKLKRIMQAILSLGNALNHGTARGSAVGFRLDSLLKLTDTRACNKKMTLMHYLCKVLAEKFPELLDFPKDLTSLEAANKIQLKYLAEEMQAISKGLEKVVQELTASESDGPVSQGFCKMLKEFLCLAEAEVRSLSSLYSGVGKNADALAHYFGEDPARCPFEQVISTLLNFVRMFVRAHEENCKQIEFARKRAQKNGDNEKANLSAFSMESDKTTLITNAHNVSKNSTQFR
ncbi:hypothetical protein ACH5RR_039425 [Cinchona calisaya]|uniref:Formin-like protein n=1 Tax=Cinchona calisaya TaxID=153742 RepID=A0ABD2Y1M1_9GENT